MARRGDQLREHILWTAKSVFLDAGFERTSMDLVARRARTSKASLYIYFESKERLFVAVIELLRELFLNRLKAPADYSDDPAEALTIFCARYLQAMLFRPSVQMVRMTLAETERFQEPATQFFDVLFLEVHRRVSLYLKVSAELTPRVAHEAAQQLLSQVLFPRYTRALFGIDILLESLDDPVEQAGIDVRLIRKLVQQVLAR